MESTYIEFTPVLDIPGELLRQPWRDHLERMAQPIGKAALERPKYPKYDGIAFDKSSFPLSTEKQLSVDFPLSYLAAN